MPTQRRPVAFRLASVAVAFALAGCSGELSTLDPAGPAARDIAGLWWAMLAGATLLFILVIALLYMAMRASPALAAFAPRRWLVWGGLALPAVVLTALVAYALVLGERLIPHALAGSGPVRVSAESGQWFWQFSYPDRPDLGTTAEMHIPAGEPVDVVVTSRDVIHSFWVPRLAGKIDAIPGHENLIRIEADRPGTYRGACAEFCGTSHAEMYFTVVAHDAEAWRDGSWGTTP